jgi:formate hydrogenlyase subunit 3/multisubunit Na+/H+ antiporter MnhD subunit
MSMAVTQAWLVAAVSLPACLAALWLMSRLRRAVVAVAPWTAAPALALALVGADVTVRLPGIFTGIQFVLDGPGRAFLLLAGLLWLGAGIFARSYHAGDPRKATFFWFFLLTMTGNFGVVTAGDPLSFYLFFAVMTFAAYGLVVHRHDAEAGRAGRVYIVMALLGETAFLAALFIIGAAGGARARFGPELDVVWTALAAAPGTAEAVALLLVVGLGVKAGLAPLHLWLPLAHPVAPTAASALLSGVMIKGGVLGWIRFLPGEVALPVAGGTLAILGAATIFYGVVAGLPQRDPKTILAYSSVSQMGYMAAALGIGLLAPQLRSVAISGVILFALHHGLAKGSLFLSVGVVDRTAGDPGTGRRWWVLLASALPALALAGAPLTSGARAKGALEGALVGPNGAWHDTVEPLLLAAAAGTTLLMAHFLTRLARRADASAGRSMEVGDRRGLIVPWALLVAASASGGLWLVGFVPGLDGSMLAGPLDKLWKSALPILVAGSVAWLVLRRPDILGPMRVFRVPPGDLVVVVEGLLRRIRRAAGAAPGRSPARPGTVGQFVAHVARGAGWVAERDLLLVRGSIFGVLLLGLFLLLLTALV